MSSFESASACCAGQDPLTGKRCSRWMSCPNPEHLSLEWARPPSGTAAWTLTSSVNSGEKHSAINIQFLFPDGVTRPREVRDLNNGDWAAASPGLPAQETRWQVDDERDPFWISRVRFWMCRFGAVWPWTNLAAWVCWSVAERPCGLWGEGNEVAQVSALRTLPGSQPMYDDLPGNYWWPWSLINLRRSKTDPTSTPSVFPGGQDGSLFHLYLLRS